ncbi:hypothetical protein COLU111180_04095 [Cohnella lubricantis]|uniref:Phage tail protein n=1 Tax=Cohnella lubricantis TaxID=2163172 RepID=A0A841TB83_9BACL|nr:hypothetical protein [Cohnella lubricantis]MBB6676510.1 hypothetical protein [Cohnella lubricantis]MBP2117130.1 hypothetical protein [Cohnella lubricantis]
MSEIVDKIFAGPGIFIWGVDETGANETDAVTVDLTQGGITFTTTTSYFEPKVDQFGDAPVKSVITSIVGAVTFDTPDMDFEKVVKFNPNADKITDATTTTKVKYEVSGLAGQELPRKRAVIKPLGVSDPSRFIYIEACAVKFDLNAGFKNDDNLKQSISAAAYPSTDPDHYGLLYTWGDISAAAAAS